MDWRNHRRKGKGQPKPAAPDPSRPSIDLAQIKARYRAPDQGWGGQGEAEAYPPIEFVDAPPSAPAGEATTPEGEEAEAAVPVAGEDGAVAPEAALPGAEGAAQEGGWEDCLDEPQEESQEEPQEIPALFPKEAEAPGGKRRKWRRKKVKGKGKRKRGTPGPKGKREREKELDLVDLSKAQPRPRKKLRVSRNVIEKGVMFCGLVLMGCILATLYYWLLIQRIEVEGNTTIPRADVLSQAGINVGEHILLVNTGEARARLLENSLIQDATIQRVYPDKLRIIIQERQPIAAIAGGGSYAIIDAEGYVISIEKSPGDLLEVFGMGSTGFQVNQRLGETGDFYSNILISVIEALNQAGIAEDMQSLDMTQPLSVNLESKDGYTIHLGQTEDLLDKLANLPAIIQRLEEMGLQGGTIDLAVQGDPVYSPPETAAPETDDTQAPQQDDGEGEEAPQQTPAPQESPAAPSDSEAPAQPPATSGGSNFDG